LTVIFIMILTYQTDQLLAKFKINKYITPNFITVVIGLIIGLLAHFMYSEESIEDMRQT
jgi:hypothetical protein